MGDELLNEAMNVRRIEIGSGPTVAEPAPVVWEVAVAALARVAVLLARDVLVDRRVDVFETVDAGVDRLTRPGTAQVTGERQHGRPRAGSSPARTPAAIQRKA